MKIAIAGYGQEGAENYAYWAARGHELTIFDEKPTLSVPLPKGSVAVLGEGAFGKMDGHDLVVRTAGLAPRKITSGGKLWSATNEFFAECPATIIGVTGTKGKGTTCSMIAEILRAAGKTVWLVGNIGIPALGQLSKIGRDDIVVFELSSFQLWDIQASPHVAVVLGIEPDHLDNHLSFDEYVSAKARITQFQSSDDLLVFKPSNAFSAQIANDSPAKIVGYGEHGDAHIEGDAIYYGEHRVCVTSSVVVPGQHNHENACAAVAAVRPYVHDGAIIAKGLSNFHGLPHHLEFVRELDGVKYYDDSFSATPSASVVAMQAFTQPKIMIMGGYVRPGASLDEIAEAVISTTVKKVVLMGQNKRALQDALESRGYTDSTVVEGADFERVLSTARTYVQPGYIVILSPGAPSFDMFKNFYERGNRFQEIVASW